MAFLIIIGIIIFTVIVVMVISGTVSKYAGSRGELLGIKTVKSKNDISLIASSPLRMNLVLRKNTKWTRFFEGMSLFQQPKSGDKQFDEIFSITAYRVDVMWVLRKNPELRRILIQMSKVIPSFNSLSYSHQKLSLSIKKAGAFSQGTAVDSAREILASNVPSLVEAFEKLSSDTAPQARARVIDVWGPNLPFITLLILMIVGASHNQPLASGQFPWKFVLLGSVLFMILQIVLLFQLTKQGAARIQGLLIAFFAAVVCSYTAMPDVIRGINASSQHGLVTETVDVAELVKVVPRKGARHYYVMLSGAPIMLTVGHEGATTSLEVSYDLYGPLEHQGVHYASHLKIAEATGLLGMPFVVQATPL
ncbi:hypothetical protein [Glaciimonas sp. PCH181]|uniref:hypothetical protein n=1 Tax=Glaciimonas sp. PCH181 TaxID=2133943 RepID=UPI000D37FA7E|nr:hypothetical protein [Glaciimonas sp. PCH181]